MGTYGVLILGFIGALWWYNYQRQKRLDADPAQRELAALMTAVVQGRRPGSSGRDVSDYLATIASSGSDRRVRLTHAVMLVRSEAAPDLYAKVLALSREIS